MTAGFESGGYDGAWSTGVVVPSSGTLRPLSVRSSWAIVALVAVGLALLFSAVVDWLEIDLMNRLTGGGHVTIGDLDASDTRQRIANVAYLLGVIVAAFFFIRWFHAAYANLLALGHKALRFKPGWAIGAWFVPFINLRRPKQIANDIWSGSAESALSVGGSGFKDLPASSLLGWWWGTWLASSFLSNVAARAWFDTKTPDDIRTADWIDLLASAIGIVAVVLAIVVVRRVTERQAVRAQRLAAVDPRS